MRITKTAVLLTALAFASAFSGTTASAKTACQTPPAVASKPIPWSNGTPSESLQMMYRSVWEYIRDSFFDPSRLKDFDRMQHAFDDKIATIDDLHLALKELAAAAGDKWTSYTSPAEAIEFMQAIRGGMLLSGLDIYNNDGNMYQVDVITYGSPAYGSRLRERDYVRCINGIDISKLPKQAVNEMLRGKNGTKIVITAIAREDGSEYTVELTLTPTRPMTADVRLLAGDILYIRLPTFDDDRYAADVVARVATLIDEVASRSAEVKGIVLDLRNNLGGDLNVAVNFASLFLSGEKTVVVKSVTRETDGFHTKDLFVTPDNEIKFARGQAVDARVLAVLRAGKLAVLVNGSSASASEVTIGALKDNERGTSFGTVSFGKGVGFKVRRGPIGGGAVSVTGLKYLTPDGHDVHERGIAPDVVVEQPRDGQGDAQLEAALEMLRQ